MLRNSLDNLRFVFQESHVALLGSVLEMGNEKSCVLCKATQCQLKQQVFELGKVTSQDLESVPGKDDDR